MGARQRQSVGRSPSSDSRMTYTEFMRRFPDSDACLEYLKERHYPNGTPCPKCSKPSRFHKIRGRSAYSCQYCGHHVYPTAGTIFHKSTTSLQLWFFGIYLISSSKCGISAKQFGREIGVSYKTAHRMMKQIRHLLSDDDSEPLSGDVELDETFVGGKPRASDTRGMTHAEAGAWLVERWGLSPVIVEAIRNHHSPSSSLQAQALTAVVHIADVLCGRLEIGPLALEPALAIEEDALKALNISASSLSNESLQIYAANLKVDLADAPSFEGLVQLLKRKLIEALESLPSKEKLVFTLYHYESLSFREIAHIINIGESDAQRLYASVLKKLTTTINSEH